MYKTKMFVFSKGEEEKKLSRTEGKLMGVTRIFSAAEVKCKMLKC